MITNIIVSLEEGVSGDLKIPKGTIFAPLAL